MKQDLKCRMAIGVSGGTPRFSRARAAERKGVLEVAEALPVQGGRKPPATDF